MHLRSGLLAKFIPQDPSALIYLVLHVFDDTLAFLTTAKLSVKHAPAIINLLLHIVQDALASRRLDIAKLILEDSSAVIYVLLDVLEDAATLVLVAKDSTDLLATISYSFKHVLEHALAIALE